jgi:anthranilate synthase
MSTTEQTRDFNAVPVAKEGGRGVETASQQALERGLSLGAPPARPKGGHFLTKGGIQVTANIKRVKFSRSLNGDTSSTAIEKLIDQLDDHRGVLLTSSYEFPGRYARWSLGFVDPPLEVAGKGSHCTIRALNQRGRILLPAVVQAMEALKADGILAKIETFTDDAMDEGTGDAVESFPTRIDVTVVPPSEVGTFSEEERSKQVSLRG